MATSFGRERLSAGVGVLVLASSLLCAASAQMAAQINALTGSVQTRVVWLEGGDLQWGGGILKGFDTQTDLVTTILPALYRQSRPILCTGGTRIVYTVDGSSYIVNWDGTGKRLLVAGIASDVWVDPGTGLEWVIVRVGADDTTGEYRRYQIENTAVSVQLCTRGGGFPQTAWWQVSADGTLGAELLPWPFFALLTNGGLDLVQGADRVNPQISAGTQAEGCWSSMACDNSYWSFHFDKNAPGGNAHGHLFMFHNHVVGSNVTISASPLPAGSTNSFYHPKFASGSTASGGRFLTLTSNDGGAATLVEVYFGKFNSTYTGFDGWVRMTSNSVGDFYPDCWVGVQSATPSILLNPSTLQFSAQQGGANPANQNVAVTTQSGSLTSVAASSNQTWLTTSVSGAGASWTIVNSINIAGLTAGTHTATVTVTASGVPSNNYTVNLVIGTPQATSIQITPASDSLAYNQQVQFAASVLDQQRNPLVPQPAVAWSLNGTGSATLSAAGLFAAGNNSTTYRVIAVSGSLRDTSPVIVYRAITMTYPAGGEHFTVGQTINVRWTAAAIVGGIAIEVSADDGLTWCPVTSAQVTPTSATWGNYPWVIPATVVSEGGAQVSLGSSTVRMRIYNYQDRSMEDITPQVFSVPVLDPARLNASARVVSVSTRNGLAVSVPWAERYTVEVYGLSGALAGRVNGVGAGNYLLTRMGGVYLVKVSSASRSWVQRGVVVGK